MSARYRGGIVARVNGRSMTMFRLFVAHCRPRMLTTRGAPDASERATQIAIDRKRLSGRQR